ncbi:MAG: hypothetical protein CM15mP79_2400 [Methanobacteriota archaeon]|nr:MAG: hypothetical protein CM15mP79_2400 [Euryarchaeota archaeon]
MIVTTMDVARCLPARPRPSPAGQHVAYDVTPIKGLGTRGNGRLDHQRRCSETDPSTNDYKLRYMKSDAELTLVHHAPTEPRPQRIMDGPTAWDGSGPAAWLQHGHQPHRDLLPSNISEVTGCRTGASGP